MARHPDWFERLDAIRDTVYNAHTLEWVGRNEIKAIFGCGDRDAIRLLHKLGADTRSNALTLHRSSLLSQLDAISRSSTYARFLQHRHNVAQHLTAASAESRTRQFAVAIPSATARCGSEFDNLPATISWRRSTPDGPARFEIVYRDGADLMTQLAEFLSATGTNREEFFAATEPSDVSAG